ncbi:MAG: hypothetical protein FJ279_26345 [Planctomycetes bacterium]|nr:hypothetical protein [Planctomycetota bacterium]
MNELTHVLGLFEPDRAVVDMGKKRQAAMWWNRDADFVPILLGGPGHPERSRFPKYNLKECYYDRDRMLMEHLWGMIGTSNGRSDAVPSMRCNSGTGTLPTVFGCVSTVFEDKMPWVTTHLSKAAVEAFEPTDIASKGEMPRVLDYMRYFAEKLNGKAAVYCADHQGPFDVAHLVYGDTIFTDVVDDPAFVHRLLDKCTVAMIEAVKLMKAAVGEPAAAGYHGGNLYMENGGVRICEDTPTLLNATMVDEFVIPYTRRVLAAFGGGWIHYCGGTKRLFDQFVRVPEARGINFGNPERYAPSEILGTCLALGKFYYGSFRREPSESLEAYYRRILGGLNGHRKGLIFVSSLKKDDPPAPQAVELWRKLQQ